VTDGAAGAAWDAWAAWERPQNADSFARGETGEDKTTNDGKRRGIKHGIDIVPEGTSTWSKR